MSPKVLRRLAVLGPEAIIRLAEVCFAHGEFRVVKVEGRKVTVECAGKTKVVEV